MSKSTLLPNSPPKSCHPGPAYLRWKPDGQLVKTQDTPTAEPLQIGVLRGEGVGPEVVESALDVLKTIGSIYPIKYQIEFGGAIGRQSEKSCGSALSDEVEEFCSHIFHRGGVILSGPGGGRYVYNLRQKFDLYCKLNPIRVFPELAGQGHLSASHVENVDIIVVREGASGLYQGSWGEEQPLGGVRQATHNFSYSEDHVQRIIASAAQIAQQRNNRLAVIYKESGVPTISELWRHCAEQIAAQTGVSTVFLDVDYSAYQLLQHPKDFDVVVAPNLFGDILADLGGVLLGSRALTYGGNFGPDGSAFYQTNHGSAYDLAGSDRCNPLGQILSLAFLLKQSFGLHAESQSIQQAVQTILRAGWRTEDMAQQGSKLVGTKRMTELVCEEIR